MNTVTPLELTCEYAVNPLGIDVVQPRFSWILKSSQQGEMQSAYQILVASSVEKVKENIADKWNSKKVTSDESVNVTYEGSPLASAEKCYWKVRIWNQDEEVSPYSSPATLEMGLLQKDDWQGVWIGAKKDISSPLFRKEFKLAKEIKRARIYISGLGFYELYINGKKVGDHVLDPALTDYRKRVLYVIYDIKDVLREGRNTIGVMLGNGWYSDSSVFGIQPKFGDSPRLLLQMNIEFADGMTVNIKSDKTWKVSSGPIICNNLHGGEIYDARLEKPGWTTSSYDGSGWANAEIVSDPGGKMVTQLMPAMKVVETIKPVKFTSPKAGVYVYDFGQLFGGWVRLHVKGSRDTKIIIKYSSRMLPSGLIDEAPYPGDQETDFYILKGYPKGEAYEPRFTFHPVRYVQITGCPSKLAKSNLEGRVIHSAVDLSGDFHCSNPLLNQIHRSVTWTLRNALKGFPLDCLHREPIAYNEPASVSSILYTRKYMPLFWTKWLSDIKGTQRQEGWISDLAPDFPGIDRQPDAAQAGNYPALVWYLYQYYEDKRILADHYSAMKAWADYLTSNADGYIITTGWLGDHMLPGKFPGEEEFVSKETPPPLIWTGYYYCSVSIVSQVADVLGKTNDVVQYTELAEKIKDALNDEFFDKSNDNYARGSQTSNVFPLVLGIVPKGHQETVVRNIIRDIMEKQDGHIHTGHVGTTSMIEALTKFSDGKAMYQIATTTTYPGWGYMVRQGATTIWESWGGDWVNTTTHRAAHRADSMMMWGCIDKFFYNYLAGIGEPDYHGLGYMVPGFRKIEIKPHVLGDLTSASASIKTVRGMVSSSWEKTDDSLTLEVSIPVNSQAKVSIPKMGLDNVTVKESGKTIFEDGSYIGGVMAVTDGNENTDYVTFEVGSGSYSFKLSGNIRENT